MVTKSFEYYKANAGPHKRLGVMIEKIGLDEFRKAVMDDEIFATSAV